MFHLVLNMLYLQCQPIDRFLFDTNFSRKVFPKQAIEIWILIPKFHKIRSNFAIKKSTLNVTKFASLQKVHTKIILVKINFELNDLGFLCYSAKVCPDLSRFIKAHFSTFISPFFDITIKMGN